MRDTDEHTIPLVDLAAQYEQIGEDLRQAIQEVFERGDFIMGLALREFEAEFASYCGRTHSLGCASGTDALILACKALGIGQGDEVILPAMTFIATAIAVSMTGAKPVLADVNPDTGLIDVGAIDDAITTRTRAVIPVHLYGQVAPMRDVMDLAKSRGLFVIEDAAQAHGAVSADGQAGSFGDISCFSFYPGKNLGAYGDGGAVVFDDSEIHARVSRLRNLGASSKSRHEAIGLNSRLDTLQAAALRVKLRHLDQWNESRRSLARRYSEILGGSKAIQLSRCEEGSSHHLYVIRLKDRDRVFDSMRRSGMGVGTHYPLALHEQPALKDLGYSHGDLPVAEDWARRCLSLPLYPELTHDDQDRVCERLKESVDPEVTADAGKPAC